MIREAKYIDNIRLGELMREMHEKSAYAGRATLREDLFKNICITAISQHGKKACLFVEEKDGVVESFIVGCLDRIYGISKEFYATDLFFYSSERASNRAAIGLLKAFTGWAESAENVIEIRLGITGTIGGWDKLAKLYERLGYSQDGVMMAKGL